MPPGLPIDMGHGARVAHLPRSTKADSERRAQRAIAQLEIFNAEPSTDFPESVRNIQLGLGVTSLKGVVRFNGYVSSG